MIFKEVFIDFVSVYIIEHYSNMLGSTYSAVECSTEELNCPYCCYFKYLETEHFSRLQIDFATVKYFV